jgi:hypothetical protein
MSLKPDKGQLAVDRSDIEVKLAAAQKLLNELRDYRRVHDYPLSTGQKLKR